MSDCPTEEVYCQNCGALIGRKHYGVTTAVWLRLATNPIDVLSIDGVCKCGRAFHWKQSDEFYKHFMRRYPELATGAAT